MMNALARNATMLPRSSDLVSDADKSELHSTSTMAPCKNVTSRASSDAWRPYDLSTEAGETTGSNVSGGAARQQQQQSVTIRERDEQRHGDLVRDQQIVLQRR